MKSLSITLLFLFVIGNAYAQDTLSKTVKADSLLFTMDTFQHIYPVKDFAQVLKDPTGKYEITDFLDGKNNQLFKPLAEFNDKDFSQPITPPWIKVSIQNNLTDQNFWSFELWMDSDSTLAYIINEDNSIDSFKQGQLISYEETESGVDYLNDVYDSYKPVYFNIKKGERKEIYYKIYSNVAKKRHINPRVSSMMTRYKIQHGKHFSYIKTFFYLGLIWMLFAYNLIIFFSYKNRGYLYLALYILCFSIPSESHAKQLIYREWFSNFPLFLDLPWVVLSPLLFIFLTLFMREYLNAKKLYPKVDLIFKTMIGISFIYFAIMIGNYLIHQKVIHSKVVLITTIQTVIQMSLFIVVSIRLFKYKKAEIRFLILSIAVLLFFDLLDRLPEIFGWWSFENAINSFLLPITVSGVGVLLQILIWTMGLGAVSRRTEQEKQLLEEKDSFKSQFFVNISHEFRTPLTLVLGPIQQIIDKTTDKKDKELLVMAHRNANRQLHLINELLDLSKLEANKMQLQASENDFVPVLRGIVSSYDSLAAEKGIILEMKMPNQPVLLYFDQEKLEKVFYNLITNAFKFTPSGGTISVSMVQKKKSISIEVADTGKGISKDQLENIFNRFFQADEGKDTYYESSGIGLTLTKELVELHHGTISVKSQLGKRTTFFLEFPLGSKHLQKDEIVEQQTKALNKNLDVKYLELKENLETEAIIPVSNGKPSKLPKLLIVEDNRDMLAFIRQKLEGDYQVIEAFDGEEGIKRAFEHIPDLIISDVMMPKKNGYEVCKTLKTDVRTSHIPVILLTAKAAQTEKIEGLETGADDYLTKPFDAKELSIRVQNLISIREQLRQRFAAAINLKPSEVTTNSIDAEFLKNAMKIVEANIDDENFNIDIFTQKIGMSRSTLNRKLKALTNQSTNQFIQAARLNRAADLLLQQSGTVAEIAFQTGFRSTAYFVKCFKDKFGVTPGKFE